MRIYKRYLFVSWLLAVVIATGCQPGQNENIPDAELFPGAVDTTATLPDGFEQVRVLSGLESPSTMLFTPDGRLLVDERIKGVIRVLLPDGTLLPEPMLTLDVPKDEEGQPTRHYNAGIGSFIFDPGYPEEPYIYVSYMKDRPRHNRVSRFQIDQENPNRAIAESEEVLIELPFNDTGTAGSDNGLALVFGDDGYLYISTGDGLPGHKPWEEGDPVQSLETFTGKILRINRDGSIPDTNPFYNRTSGDFRAIYALGLRNPYTLSKHPVSGNIYINDISMSPEHIYKDYIYLLQEGSNYMWDGTMEPPENPVGVPREPVAYAGQRVITGGAWYPGSSQEGYFPEEYHGNYFIALWGPSESCQGQIVRMISEDDNEIVPFLCLSRDGMNGRGTPVFTQVGPDGDLYWLATTYVTNDGSIFKISYAGEGDTE